MKRTVEMLVKGPWACFTMPEIKGERVSFPVMTPTAADGVASSIHWKPEMRYQIRSVGVVNEIKFTTMTFNELAKRFSTPGDHYCEDNRTQRRNLLLRDVCYHVVMDIFLSDLGKNRNSNVEKHYAIFNSRLNRGRYYKKPFLGMRNFSASVFPVTEKPEYIPQSANFGLMPWSIEYKPDGNRVHYFHAIMRNGVVDVPDEPVKSGDYNA